MLAAIQHFSPYLIIHPFVIETDHRALAFFNTTSHANGHLAKLALILQPYTLTIHYHRGSQNAFSRLVDVEADSPNDIRSQ